MKYPVLGFLIDQPMHGYELKRALSPALPPERRVNDGVLYPLLKRMEAEGLIRKRVEPGGGPTATCSIPRNAGGACSSEWLAAGRRERRGHVRLPARAPVPDKCLFFSELTPAQEAREARGPARGQPREARDVPSDQRGHGRAGSGPPPRCGARPRNRATEGEGAMAEANDQESSNTPARRAA